MTILKFVINTNKDQMRTYEERIIFPMKDTYLQILLGIIIKNIEVDTGDRFMSLWQLKIMMLSNIFLHICGSNCLSLEKCETDANLIIHRITE